MSERSCLAERSLGRPHSMPAIKPAITLRPKKIQSLPFHFHLAWENGRSERASGRGERPQCPPMAASTPRRALTLLCVSLALVVVAAVAGVAASYHDVSQPGAELSRFLGGSQPLSSSSLAGSQAIVDVDSLGNSSKPKAAARALVLPASPARRLLLALAASHVDRHLVALPVASPALDAAGHAPAPAPAPAPATPAAEADSGHDLPLQPRATPPAPTCSSVTHIGGAGVAC
ncbi:hypothetical protein ACP70R_028622 [Stipagrostis hirtigluma subsp. patula]